MKIGVAIPCSMNDQKYLDACLQSIRDLHPRPYLCFVDFNRGPNLKTVRARLFDSLFSSGCDVVLQCSSDFYLFPHILKHVHPTKVTSFPFLSLELADIPLTMFTLIGRNFTGCYSLPKETWLKIRSEWDGLDVLPWVGRQNYVMVKQYCYYVMRPWKEESVKKILAGKSLLSRVFWMATRLHA